MHSKQMRIKHQEKQNYQKKTKVAIGVGTVLAGAAACAGIIYGIKSGRVNNCLNKLKTRTYVANNIIENGQAKVARAAHVNQPNITATTRGTEAVKNFNTAKNSEKLERLIGHTKRYAYSI